MFSDYFATQKAQSSQDMPAPLLHNNEPKDPTTRMHYTNKMSNGMLIVGTAMVCVGVVNSIKRNPSSLNRFCHQHRHFNC
ncbi:hypothetical protein M3Y97_00610200 [Aphelenchoides bicaudatus]|nr:hypothetical protein M3Y97_00610200 [Aphelenchoides bicaudatus]